jgi:hypothetical protein
MGKQNKMNMGPPSLSPRVRAFHATPPLPPFRRNHTPCCVTDLCLRRGWFRSRVSKDYLPMSTHAPLDRHNQRTRSPPAIMTLRGRAAPQAQYPMLTMTKSAPPPPPPPPLPPRSVYARATAQGPPTNILIPAIGSDRIPKHEVSSFLLDKLGTFRQWIDLKKR